MTNTQANIGIRREFPGTSLGERNFENDGTTQYVSMRENLNFQSGTYLVDSALPFDNGSSYTAAALAELEVYWNQGWIRPAV